MPSLPLPSELEIAIITGLAAIAIEGASGRLQTKDSFNWVDISDAASLVPTHGNFAGPGYGAGIRGNSTVEELMAYPVYRVKDPITGLDRYDKIDTIAKEHDIAYKEAQGMPDYWEQIKSADQILVNKTREALENDRLGIIKLTDSERNYGLAMLRLFEMKLKYIDEFGTLIDKLGQAGFTPAEINDILTSLLSMAGFFPNPLTLSNISPSINSLYLSGRNWAPSGSPLVIDLDGDGIETVGIQPGSPILFDNDADGIKTGTGWIKPDDGLLVMDRDGNGTIDTGRELFGVQTLMSNAEKAADEIVLLAA